MSDQLKFKHFSPKDSKSDYDYLNIDTDDEQVGKVRALVNGRTLTIYSINIFPEFQGHGYGQKTVNMLKNYFDTIIADRVRFKAIGFWEKMGFIEEGNGDWVYKKMEPGCWYGKMR